jgi:hypothetical protein
LFRDIGKEGKDLVRLERFNEVHEDFHEGNTNDALLFQDIGKERKDLVRLERFDEVHEDFHEGKTKARVFPNSVVTSIHCDVS